MDKATVTPFSRLSRTFPLPRNADQTTECFIRCLENSFRHFGGVPKTTVIDYVPRHIINVLFPTSICALLAKNLWNRKRDPPQDCSAERKNWISLFQ